MMLLYIHKNIINKILEEYTVEENVKFNFLKEIWYSIARPSKYEELRKQGIGKSILYIFRFITILVFILSIIIGVSHLNETKDVISYLDLNLPEMKFKENVLTLEKEDEVILNDNIIIEHYNSIIVLNTSIEKQEAINRYKDLATEINNVMIFLKKEIVLISYIYIQENDNEKGLMSQKYEDISSNFIKDKSYEYEKKDVIEYLNERTTYSYYIAQSFAVYFVLIVFRYLIYTIFISLAIWLLAKFLKLKWTYKDSLMNTIYALTLSILVYVLYMIISDFTKFRRHIEIISIGTVFIYLYMLIIKQVMEKRRKNKTQKEKTIK